jgi:cell division inhibitor SulA
MAAVATLESLLAKQTLWHAGRSVNTPIEGEPTGHDALDAMLPQRGWPRRSLTELLLPVDGMGELKLVMPTLARLSRGGGEVIVIAPPYIPYAPAWQAAGLDLARLEIVQASTPRDALWAFEQCLRSGACAAVLGWPLNADAQALRRLQVAADSGECLGFAIRHRKHIANPSPAALRLEAMRNAWGATVWQIRKCRGGPAPAIGFAMDVG